MGIIADRERAGRALAWVGAAALIVGCQQDPTPLGPGQCRTDVDCPGDARCVLEGDVIGRCGCFEDHHCPGVQTCGSDQRCGCTLDMQCPAGLVCADGACICEGDSSCAGQLCASDDDCPGRWRCVEGACRGPEAGFGAACSCVDDICADPEKLSAPAGPRQAPTCDVAARTPTNACGGRAPLRAEVCDPESGSCNVANRAVGDVCGVGGWGQWSCTGCETPLRCCRSNVTARLGLGPCCDLRGGVFECPSLADPTLPVAAPTGEALCCPAHHILDPCGACIDPDDPLFDVLRRAQGAAVGDACAVEATPGIWRCEYDAVEDRERARCGACPVGDDGELLERNACGGCGPLVYQGVLEPGYAPDIESEDIGEPCGGPEARHGFVSDCPGVLDCADAFTVRCLDTDIRRCDGECGAVAIAVGQDTVRDEALPERDGVRYCELDGQDPARACRSPSELAAIDNPLGEREAALDFDDLVAGRSCGECRSGRWGCDDQGPMGMTRLHCEGVDAESRNICGVCADPPALATGVLADLDAPECRSLGASGPSSCACTDALGRPGILDCDSSGLELSCTARSSNVCGGTRELAPGVAPGTVCSEPDPVPCDAWIWECIDPDTIRCVNPAVSRERLAERNECLGCSPIPDRARFPDQRCRDRTERQAGAVCRVDRAGTVCILRDEDFDVVDGDGRCHCASLDANGHLVLNNGPCYYLLDPATGARARCDDDDHRSRDCGGSNQSCCPGEGPRCDDGFVCKYDETEFDEICTRCGRAGQPCCDDAGSPCVTDHVCNRAGRCEPCGASEQRCCDTRPGCGPNLGCGAVEPGRCGPCGASGGRCCRGPGEVTCRGRAICVVDRCFACGTEDDPCCLFEQCEPGLECRISNSGPRCKPECGEPGGPCCAGGEEEACRDPDRICLADLCEPCGEEGEPCCSGPSVCEAGLDCVATDGGMQCSAP